MRARLLLVGLVLSACGSGTEGVCTSIAIGTGGAHTDVGLGQCWDSQDRNVLCDPPPGASSPITCTCSVAGNRVATFERTEPLIVSQRPTAAELAPINAGCGWSLRAAD